jgi:hypothetical protein
MRCAYGTRPVTRRAPHEPTSQLKPKTRGRGDTPPPAPPHELAHAVPESGRSFEHEGITWIARVAGRGACGTGSYGLGLVEAVHYCDATDPDRPLREARVGRGGFETMNDAELVRLLTAARPIVAPQK